MRVGFLLCGLFLLALARPSAAGPNLLEEAKGSTDAAKAAWALERILGPRPGAEAIRLLEGLVRRWPETPAATAARRWLLEIALVAGRFSPLAAGADSLTGREPAWRTLAMLDLLESQEITSFSSEIAGGEAADPSVEFLRQLLHRRLGSGATPGGDLEAYLGLEGEARRLGLLGIWLCGLREVAPEETFREIQGNLEAELRGTMEAAWMAAQQPAP
jgi:hypothetical protein